MPYLKAEALQHHQEYAGSQQSDDPWQPQTFCAVARSPEVRA